MFNFYDLRDSNKFTGILKTNNNSRLNQINISRYCLENNKIAFGGNESKVVLFDIRQFSNSYKNYNMSCSKKKEFLI